MPSEKIGTVFEMFRNAGYVAFYVPDRLRDYSGKPNFATALSPN
jgi:hypothetical protein